MKTAMQELIIDFKELSKKGGDSGFVGRSVLSIINNRNYLEKEKEQIENAVTYGNRQDYYDATEKLGNHYYNQTFKNQKL